MGLFEDIINARKKRDGGLPQNLPSGPQSTPTGTPKINVAGPQSIPDGTSKSALDPAKPTVISQGDTSKKNFLTDNIVTRTVKQALFGGVKEKAQIADLESQGVKVPFLEKFVAEGFLPFLGKTNEEQITSRQKALEKKGIDSERAADIAFYSLFANKTSKPLDPELKQKKQEAEDKLAQLSLTSKEKRTVTLQNTFQKGGEILDATTFGVGSIARKPVLSVTQKLLSKAGKVEDAVQALLKIEKNLDPKVAKTIVEQAKKLKGPEEAADFITKEISNIKKIKAPTTKEVLKKQDDDLLFKVEETIGDLEKIPVGSRKIDLDAIDELEAIRKKLASGKVLTQEERLAANELIKLKKVEVAKDVPLKQKPRELDFEPAPVTIREKFIIAAQDRLKRLNTIQKQVVEEGGKDTTTLTKARLFSGKAVEKINVVRDEFASKAKDSLISRLSKSKLDVDEFGDFLKARHAVERNAHVAKINKKLPDGGSGLTNLEANKILKATKGKGFEKFADEVYDLNKRTLDTLEEAGILSNQSRVTIEGTFDKYVPLKINKKPAAGFGGSGFSVRNSGIKRVKGSEKARVNPFVQSLVDHENAIVRSEKNKVGQEFLEFARNNPNEKLWKVDKQSFIPHFNEQGEFIMAMPRLKAADDVLEVWEKGKLFHVTIKDPELAKAMKNLGQEKAIPLLSSFNNYLRAIVTTFNPEFVISNFERDIQTALINVLGERERIKDAGQVFKNVPKAMKGIVQNLRKGDEATGEFAKLYGEFKREGAKVGWIDARDVGERAAELDRIIRLQEGRTLKDRMARKLDAVADYVEAANETVESSTRLAVYKAMKDAGKTAEEAALIARDITVDFNKKGNLGTLLNSLYLFANAGIQGSTKIFSTLYKSKLARRTTAGITAGSYGLAQLNRHINETEWDAIPDYIKDTNIVIMKPNGKTVFIRSPYGYNVFSAMGTIANDLTNQKITPAEAMKRMMIAFDSGFNPISSGSFSQFVAPTVVDPIVQVTENKNFAGNPIRPNQFPGSEKPQSQLYFSSVRNVTKDIAEKINKLTGGSSVESGKVDVSPEDLDHWIDFMGGGVGKFMTNIVETGVSFAQGEMPSVNNMPIVRKFLYENNENNGKYSVFELKERSRTKVLSETELKRLKGNIKDAVSKESMTAQEATKQLNTILNNQARLKGTKVAEEILGGEITKSEAKKMLQELSPKEAEEVVKALERLTEEQ